MGKTRIRVGSAGESFAVFQFVSKQSVDTLLDAYDGEIRLSMVNPALCFGMFPTTWLSLSVLFAPCTVERWVSDPCVWILIENLHPSWDPVELGERVEEIVCVSLTCVRRMMLHEMADPAKTFASLRNTTVALVEKDWDTESKQWWVRNNWSHPKTSKLVK